MRSTPLDAPYPRVRIASFDVFDTCLTRTVALPSDLFHVLARRLQSAVPALATEADFERRFALLRVDGERAARERCGFEEVTLREIWDVLAARLPGVTAAEGCELELATEREALRANRLTLARVEASRRAGERVVFVSDTCLPGEWLRDVLALHGFYREGDRLFASSELRLTKWSGSLYPRVLAELGVRAADVVHHGDHERSDVKMARRHRLRAVHVPDCLLSPPELALLRQVPRVSVGLSRLVATMRNVRVTAANDRDAVLVAIVAGFLGPLLALFATWILRQARADGVQRLCFLSRDAFLLHGVASRLAAAQGAPVDCRYVMTSRQAVQLPSAESVSAEAMPWMANEGRVVPLSTLLSKLELDFEHAGEALRARAGRERQAYVLNSDEDWDTLWRSLAEPAVQKRIRLRILERRRAAVDYLRHCGLFDDEPTHVVDLGWGLSSQRALNGLLAIGGAPRRLGGYYLGLQQRASSPAEAGPARALFHAVAGDRELACGRPEVLARTTAIEHIVGLAPHGTVLRYAGAGTEARPVCHDIDPAARQRVERIAHLVERFGEEAADASLDELSDDEIRAAVDLLVRNFFRSPSREVARALQDVRVAMCPGEVDPEPLARAASLREHLRERLDSRVLRALGRRHLGHRPVPWPEANEALGSRTFVHARRAWQFAKSFVPG